MQTTALGMGVHARHVRRVIHIIPPSTLENYFAEVGRAGRDGYRSEAVLHGGAHMPSSGYYDK